MGKLDETCPAISNIRTGTTTRTTSIIQKQKYENECIRIIQEILKSQLSCRNVITSLNTFAVSIIRYRESIIKWHTENYRIFTGKLESSCRYIIFHKMVVLDCI